MCSAGCSEARPSDGYHWAAVIVWPAVWAFHWRIETAEGQPSEETQSVRRLYLYLTSLVGLAMLAVGAFRIVGFILLEGYDALLSVPVILPSEASVWRPAMRSVVSLALVGGAAWASSIGSVLVSGRRSGRCCGRSTSTSLQFSEASISTLVALGFLIFGALAWLLGVPSIESATDHFRFLPAAVAGLSVGIALWAYHWAAVRGEAGAYEQEALGAERGLRLYLVSAGTRSAGRGGKRTSEHGAGNTDRIVAPAAVAGEDLWREPIALTIALAILGGSTWGYFWTGVPSAACAPANPARDRRRPGAVFMYAALGRRDAGPAGQLQRGC